MTDAIATDKRRSTGPGDIALKSGSFALASSSLLRCRMLRPSPPASELVLVEQEIQVCRAAAVVQNHEAAPVVISADEPFVIAQNFTNH